MLDVHNLKYSYPDGHEALKGISFHINTGEKVALIGANGSGKSTLLLHLAGALRARDGRILFRGSDDFNTLRKNTGLIFQNPDDQILMPRVIEDVAFSLVSDGMKIPEAHERAMNVLNSLGISHLADRSPHKLSGGEKRMITFAGVLISNPEILLLDEPTSALDLRARKHVINFLRDTDKAILLATHDLSITPEICTRALIMNEGVIAADGALPEILDDEKIINLIT